MSPISQLKNKMVQRERLFAYLQIVLGCVLGGAAYPLFLTPNLIAPGGLTGVSTILYHFTAWPVGTTSLIMNIPLFLIGFRSVGPVFVFRSLVATVLFSLSIDLLQFQPMTMDPLLASLFGGILLGIGLGLILRGGATTGGTDMVARLVHRRIPSITVGMFLFALDFVVVITAGIVLGSGEALYALICIAVSSKVIDVVMVGFTADKACFIMSTKWEEISDQILHGMNRGVTHLQARGGWSKEERPVVLCVVGRSELPAIKEIVRSADSQAFMFITEAHEALGEGFSRLDKED